MDVKAHITELELKPRTYNALRRNGIAIIELLLMQRVQELISLRNFGEACFNDMVDRLIANGFLPKDTYRWKDIPWRGSSRRMMGFSLSDLNPRLMPPRKETVQDDHR